MAMSEQQFETLRNELGEVRASVSSLRDSMISKADVFQAVMTVQAFFAATIVGVVVVLNTLGFFG